MAAKKTFLKQSTNQNVPWVEKYRPRKVDDIVYQEEVVSVLKKVLQGADLPNLLFYGPPGTGKTSAAVALCHQLFKTTDNYRDRVLELNASDERGISIVRNKIKDFARLAVASNLPDGSPVIGIKVIILDEADAMTAPAQAALRRTMEKESSTTRFFFICNYLTKIIDPLSSRCAKFRFKPLTMESQLERLQYICGRESVNVEDIVLKEIISLCEGDLRKSVTCVQTMSASVGELSVADVREMFGAIPDDIVYQFYAACMQNFDSLLNICESICRQGYGVYQLITQLLDVIMDSEDFTGVQKAAIFDKLALCEYRLISGANEFVQILDLGSVILRQSQPALQ